MIAKDQDKQLKHCVCVCVCAESGCVSLCTYVHTNHRVWWELRDSIVEFSAIYCLSLRRYTYYSKHTRCVSEWEGEKERERQWSPKNKRRYLWLTSSRCVGTDIRRVAFRYVGTFWALFEWSRLIRYARQLRLLLYHSQPESKLIFLNLLFDIIYSSNLTILRKYNSKN